MVLGHSASGKSAYAEALVEASSDTRTYLATARAWDDEMRAKIARHAARRGPDWRTVEVPEALADALDDIGPGGAVLLDCATMWLLNVTGDAGGAWQDAADAWIAAATACRSPVTIVSNDVGGGVVPANAMARRFQRDQGLLNQRLAARADRVALVTAGLPQWLKGGP
nr:bifunctional adenosylcobinamide kinase/adenosylcobinamide-phosphate guanylyltransferase [Jannaschia sp. Os4]